MGKVEKIITTGNVLKVNANRLCEVEVKENYKIQAHISGKLKMKKLQIVEGDLVKVAISPYDLDRGIIIDRLKKK